jgi:hypothetical protein
MACWRSGVCSMWCRSLVLLIFSDASVNVQGRRTACLSNTRAANQYLVVGQSAACSVETALVSLDVGFHKMVLGLAAVGEVEDPVMVLHFRLNVMALAEAVVGLKHRTAGSSGYGAETSMP